MTRRNGGKADVLQHTIDPARRARSHDLVGRDSERRVLEAKVASAQAGRAESLLITGTAGIGKTALLRWLVGRAADAGFAVTTVTGAPFETGLSFSGLIAALRPFRRYLGRIDPAHADALRAALNRGEVASGALLTYAATLSLLTEAAEAVPVMVVVDDTQWLDRPSLEALAFAARRCDHDRIAFVFAHAGPPLPVLERAAGTELRLGDLEREHVIELLARDGVVPAVAERCWSLTGGNPLALAEGVEGLVADERAGRAPLPALLPAAREPHPEIHALLGGLGPRALRALTVAALVPDGDMRVIAAAFETVGASPADLPAGSPDAAEPGHPRGTVAIRNGRLVWSHPLLRSAVVAQASDAWRREAHGALAGALPATQDADTLAWHIAESVPGPDDTAADRLEALAHDVNRAGRREVTAIAWERAAALSTTEQDRQRRTLAAAVAWSSQGDHRRALGLVASDRHRPNDPLAQAEIALLLARAEAWRHPPYDLMMQLGRNAAAVIETTPALATELLLHASVAGLVALDPIRTADAARRARLAAGRADDPAGTLMADAVASLAAMLSGADEAGVIGAAPRARAALHADVPCSAELTTFCALGHVAGEDWATAADLLARCLRRADQLGSLGDHALATAVQVDLAWRQGRWEDSIAQASQSLSLQQASGAAEHIPLTLALLARCEAGLGDGPSCREHAQLALTTAEGFALDHVRVIALHALGLEALGRGDYAAAAMTFDQVEALTRGVAEPGWLWWRADAIEAWHGAGRVHTAQRELDVLAAQSAASGRRWAQAAERRTRGIVERGERHEVGDCVDEELTAALSAFQSLGAPFEEARTLALRGTSRIAAGRPKLGSRDLAAARHIFDRLGARVWSQLASAARGEGHGGTSSLTAHLTPAELRVALAVGRGATNREAAETLFVSVKTVGYHLENVYRKLGIRSRSQLAAIVATHD